MTERTGRIRLRRWRPRGLGWFVVLVAALAGAVLIGGITSSQLRLATPDQSRVSEVRSVLAGLPEQPLALLAMDADLGTYPEIRPAVRAVIADLLSRGSRIAAVSFTPEGRAIAAAEMQRLRDAGVDPQRLLDVGFVAGAEAGLVLSVTDLPALDASDPLTRTIVNRGGGIAAFDMALVVGGSDFGARSWVEQVSTRLPELPVVVVAPTFAEPELAPYLRTGQIGALLATVRDDAAYASDVAARVTDAPTGGMTGQSPAAMLVGMLVALGFIVRSQFGSGGPTDGHQLGDEDVA
jgi:hypothetical protein